MDNDFEKWCTNYKHELIGKAEKKYKAVMITLIAICAIILLKYFWGRL